ncbi:hypothetical protein MICRO8M_110352 [Microbacterium sp. 8M]|nr:hypothetical protein MICRO8M_110352 [Microbacterium sp. 8M]
MEASLERSRRAPQNPLGSIRKARKEHHVDSERDSIGRCALPRLEARPGPDRAVGRIHGVVRRALRAAE